MRAWLTNGLVIGRSAKIVINESHLVVPSNGILTVLGLSDGPWAEKRDQMAGFSAARSPRGVNAIQTPRNIAPTIQFRIDRGLGLIQRGRGGGKILNLSCAPYPHFS
jgi:hypothetical protein